MLARDRLLVVGSGDSVDHLRLIKVFRAFDYGYEADENTVTHHLRFEARGAIGVPHRLPPIGKRHTHPALVHTDPRQMGVDPAIAQRVGDPSGPVLVHPSKLPPALARACAELVGQALRKS